MHKTDRFRQRKWGVFVHFLGSSSETADDWNRRVDAFDCKRFAEQLEEVDAGYVFMTAGQGSGHYCAPNEYYDRITGIRPSKCSRRDLFLDLYESLSGRHIDLMAYVPADGSNSDVEARTALGMGRHWDHEVGFSWAPGPHWASYRWPEYYAHWENVCREWSLRWGDKVGGWWVDGAFAPELRYPDDQSPNLSTFAAALRAGNSESLVAFNTGVFLPPLHCSDEEDFIAGEVHASLPECYGGWVERQGGHKALHHILTYLGRGWGAFPPRFPIELVAGYTKHILSFGGVMTWDLPVLADGSVPPEYMEYLKAIGRAAREVS